jgi:hypothetical protein
VNALKGTGNAQQPEFNVRIATYGRTGGKAENRPHPYTADKEAVAHGLNMIGKHAFGRQHQLIKGLDDNLLLLTQKFLYIKSIHNIYPGK